MRIFLIGHTSPDLDAMSAPISFAEFLKKTKRYEESELIPVRAGEPNKETKFVFERFAVELPKLIEDFDINPTDAFILIDHNEESQRHKKVVSDQVIEIVDHHKINVNFAAPVRLDVRPTGSTSSVIYELFAMYGLDPSEKVSGLILASILSDTQGLKSSTTAGYDSDSAHEIAKKLGLDIEKFTFELFKAKSDITGMTPQEIAEKDYKIFDFGGKKVFINQLETVEPEKILAMKDQIASAMEETKSKLGAGQAYTVVTDILKVNSHIIYTTEEEKRIIEQAFTTEGEENVADIGPRMSRKKDIAPEIEKVITG